MWRLMVRVLWRRKVRILTMACFVAVCVAAQAGMTAVAAVIFATGIPGTHLRGEGRRLAASRRDPLPIKVSRFIFSEDEFVQLANVRMPSVKILEAYGNTRAHLASPRDSLSLAVMIQTAGMMSALGVRAVSGEISWIGRAPSDMGAIVSDRVAARLGYRPDEIVGETITLNSVPWTVQGVALTFSGLETEPVGIFIPLEAKDRLRMMGVPASTQRQWLQVLVFGSGTDPGNMEDVVRRTVQSLLPGLDANSVHLETLNKEKTGERSTRSTLVAIATTISGALVVLLFANLTYLVAALSLSQRRELAIHTALGGSGIRMILWRVAEPVLAIAIGICIGEAVGWLLVRPHIAAAIGLPTDGAPIHDWSVALILSVAVPLVLPVAPLFLRRLFTPDRGSSLSGHATLKAHKSGSLVLVSVQVMLMAAIIVVAVSVALSLRKLLVNAPDLPVNELYQISTGTPGSLMSAGDARRITAALGARAGLATAAVQVIPTTASQVTSLDWEYGQRRSSIASVEVLRGDSTLFHVLGLKVRFLPGSDGSEWEVGRPVLVVSAALGAAVPVGACVRVGGPQAPCATVIGVVDDVSYRGGSVRAVPTIYEPFLNPDEPAAGIFVRMSGNRGDALLLLSRLIAPLRGRGLPLTIESVAAILEASQRSLRATLDVLLVILAATALVGVSGIATAIRHAIGNAERGMVIARALGASTLALSRSVLASVVVASGAGGLAGVLVGTLFIHSGGAIVAETSAIRYDAAMITLLAVPVITLVMCAPPIRRISRMDASLSLRGQ